MTANTSLFRLEAPVPHVLDYVATFVSSIPNAVVIRTEQQIVVDIGKKRLLRGKQQHLTVGGEPDGTGMRLTVFFRGSSAETYAKEIIAGFGSAAVSLETTVAPAPSQAATPAPALQQQLAVNPADPRPIAFGSGPDTVAPSTPAPAAPLKYCTWCGEAVQSMAVICSGCGATLLAPEPVDPETQTQPANAVHQASSVRRGVTFVASGTTPLAPGVLGIAEDEGRTYYAEEADSGGQDSIAPPASWLMGAPADVSVVTSPEQDSGAPSRSRAESEETILDELEDDPSVLETFVEEPENEPVRLPLVTIGLELPEHPVTCELHKPTDTFVIGRDRSVCAATLKDLRASREHFQLMWSDDGPAIADLSSTNGTFLNGVRLDQAPARLSDGDVIELGRSSITVHIVGTEH